MECEGNLLENLETKWEERTGKKNTFFGMICFPSGGARILKLWITKNQKRRAKVFTFYSEFMEMLRSENILKREEEFLKMNAEIDRQTKSLLQKVADFKECSVNAAEFSIDSKDNTGLENPNKNEDMVNKSPPENKFDLSEYFNRIKMETASGNQGITLTNKKSQVDISLGRNMRQKGKFNASAKVPPFTLSTTNLEDQAVFPLDSLKSKSETRVKSAKFECDLIPESVKGIGQEGMVRFLTAKVKVLGDQVQAMQKEEKKLLDSIKELQTQKDKVVEEKDRLIQQVNSAKNVVVKCEQNTQCLVTQLQTSQTENNHLKKELESLKKEMRQNKQNHNANELKLNRASEELDKLKLTVQQMKQEEKEYKECCRRKIGDLTSAIKKADKQRVELLNGFKKQLIIIDNLKRQKGLIEAAKYLKSAEDDFVNFLDCNPPE